MESVLAKGRVNIAGIEATLVLSNGSQSSHSLRELKKFYCLLVGSEVQANDSTCYLLIFSNEIWLIPELTPGSADFRQWFDYMDKEKLAVVATIDYLPLSWRLVMRIFPGLEANLKILNLSELKKIIDKISIVHNLTIEEAF